MNSRRRTNLIALGLCLVLITFSTLVRAQDVKYNFDPSTDFSKFKTYKWVEVPNVQYPDQLTSNQIKQAIDSELALKGLTKTDNDKADLYVAYQVAISQEQEWLATGYGGGRYRTMGGMGTITSSTIKVGTLAFDMYDVSEKKQVWHGDATKTLDPSKDPQKNQERLQKIAKKLLKNYPPKAKK